jgi:hypothetical protein
MAGAESSGAGAEGDRIAASECGEGIVAVGVPLETRDGWGKLCRE